MPIARLLSWDRWYVTGLRDALAPPPLTPEMHARRDACPRRLALPALELVAGTETRRDSPRLRSPALTPRTMISPPPDRARRSDRLPCLRGLPKERVQ